jgi:hypothetical protein
MLSIETEPAGAGVLLQRRGEVEVAARVLGVSGTLDENAFEEEFYSLGNAPIKYEFKLKESEGAIHGGAVGSASVTRHYTEGTVRIELPGYEIVERRIRFSGDPVDLRITLLPVKREE